MILEIGFALVDPQTRPRIDSDLEKSHKYGQNEGHRGPRRLVMESEVWESVIWRFLTGEVAR